ncbi:carboxypeptidase-like regulatory domain-containing protein [Mucilaginibacter agri]|uniref:TonB-dependent receptor plug domain-containing protein n=1 Tax=Mucilaginibacter agri TaxID=2695265 RepID=A0A966DUJ1_9SPHI|nr:TonB-dependent receptor plug domain-containing protein [Mucilaginibacter agri]NCD70477.1 TonB-dependent receptor plug domain-containing protein [Mucilaginibacter agri]
MTFKKIPLYLLAFITSAIVFGFVKADDDPIKKATTQLQKWLDTYPQEKVYLHFDKPYYAVGDDIWFKAYITVGPKHELSALSGALNVELIDDRDSILQAIKLPVVSGLANGDFALPDTLNEGNYRVRAYTNWMRNAGPDYFFDKTIHIGKALNNNVFTHTAFTYTTQNGQPVVNATITYMDLAGAPFANKEVSYQIVAGSKNIARGKGITNSKGELTLSFAGMAQTQNKQARIVSKIKIDEKNTVTKVLPVTALSGKVDVQFFPESGNLVNGLPTKVAFKAVGADGLGKNINGVLIDNNNQEISTITTQHLGMGIFMVVPEAGKTYTAQITFEDGSKGTFALPKALEQGYTLSVNNTYDPDNISVRIAASPGLVGTEVNLVAQSGGNVYYAAKSKVENGIIATKVTKNRFPTGVTQLTLFNAAGEAVNERLIFTTGADDLKLDLISPQQTYAQREKMNLQIAANTPDNKPAVASLSAAVIDETKVPVDESDETTILSSILLSSDIKGYIEKPNYYFAHKDDKQEKADLDVLMLTQGYRRFEWKQLMSDSFARPIYTPETTLKVSGRVHNGNKPVVGGKVTLFTTAGGAFVLDTLTDANGRFEFKNLIFKDSLKFVIQARDAKGKKFVDIDLDNVTRQQLTANVNAPDIDVNFDSKIVPYLQSSRSLYQTQVKYGVGSHNILLKEVTIREKKKPPVDHSSNLNGAGNADQVIKAEDIALMGGCPDITQCLQGRLLGVTFRQGNAYTTRGGGQMQIIVDGIYVEGDFLTQINYTDISSIEVLRSGAYTSLYGSRGGNGVIIVNTKRGNEGNSYQRFSPGVITYSPKGFYLARTFYSPQYDDPKVNATLADMRSTIYWAPNLVTDKDGKASLGFFNAGSKGSYRIVIEGIDSDGHIGRHVYHYKVE